MIPDAVRPLSDVVDDESNVQVDDVLGLCAVYCPECDEMTVVNQQAREPVPGEDHTRIVGYDNECGHDFTPDESVEKHRERYDYGEDGFAVEVDK